MGQILSVISCNYDELNYLIGSSNQFNDVEKHWNRHFTQVGVIYWISEKSPSIYPCLPVKTIRVCIICDEWPVKNLKSSDKNLVEGHHYFYITHKTQKYYFNVDQNNWLTGSPPEEFSKFVNQWKSLLNSAETTGKKPGKNSSNRYSYIPGIW